MNSHPYEYKMLLEYISPEEKGRFPHFSHIEDQEGFTKTIDEIVAHLPEVIPEGWEVNSHNLSISRNIIIITILLRRQVEQ